MQGLGGALARRATEAEQGPGSAAGRRPTAATWIYVPANSAMQNKAFPVVIERPDEARC